MIEKIRLIVGICTFGTAYVTVDFEEQLYTLFVSLASGLISLFLVHKLQQWQHHQNSQQAQTHSQDQSLEN